MGTGSRSGTVTRLGGIVFVTLLCTAVTAAAQTAVTLSGKVLDASGASVADAAVRVNIGGSVAAETQTDANGQFEVRVNADGAREILVTAPGFAPFSTTVQPSTRTIDVTLEPAPFFEAVNVTSSRADVARVDPTSTVTVISSNELLSSGPATIDDALKAVPGFTLFRRTSSRNANPTAQGVALRGVGGSSPSRSLVLADGMPLNDAFGGWVFWDKVPQAAIDRIEVDRGSGGDLYGADALGGVIQLLTVRPARATGRVMLEGGTQGTGTVSVFGGGRANDWRYSGAGEWFNTDGYIPVATRQDPGIAPRGPVDTLLGSSHRAAQAFAGYQTDNGWRFDLNANVFSEDRDNGTPRSINSTASRHGSGDVTGRLAGGAFSARGYGGTQDYHQTFTTVNALRTAETFIRDQNVPTTFGGGGGQWLRAWGDHTLLVGAEGRYVKGDSIETPYVQNLPQLTTRAGGIDRRWSGFVQDTWQSTDRLTLVLGAHADTWTSDASQTDFTKSSSAFSPRAAAAYRITDGRRRRRARRQRTHLGAGHRILEPAGQRHHGDHAANHADADRQAARECRPAQGERRGGRRQRAADERADGERGGRRDERAFRGQHHAARQSRAAGAVVQLRDWRPVHPVRVDGLRAVARHRRAVRGRSERLHAAPRQRGGSVRQPIRDALDQPVRGGREPVRRNLRRGPHAGAHDGIAPHGPRRSQDISSVEVVRT
ncbi:MAG: hypothetical protein DMF87_03085 [Acidobacteria bacterium]|nr:MAG: hypothetical protein DMF87_03085 [Acidobacteriota bacterium]